MTPPPQQNPGTHSCSPSGDADGSPPSLFGSEGRRSGGSSRFRLRGVSRGTAFVALALATIGAGLFWRLKVVFVDGAPVGEDALFLNVLLPFLVLSFGCLVISVISVVVTGRQTKVIKEDRKQIALAEDIADLVSNLDDEHMQSFSSWLHDSIGHGLVLAKMEVEHLVGDGRLGGEDARNTLSQIDSLLSEVRGMASSIYPRILTQAGLSVALETLVLHFRKMSHLDVDSAIGEIRIDPPDERRTLAVYRTVQECLTNAAKHGGAFVWVSVSQRCDRVCGTVLTHVREAVSGRAVAAKSSGGLGLELMAMRVRKLGGNFQSAWVESNVFKVEFAA